MITEEGRFHALAGRAVDISPLWTATLCQARRLARLAGMGLDELMLTPFTARDAARHGVTRHRLGRLCHDGDVVRMLYGVYASRYLEDSLSTRAAAVALVLPRGGVLCRRTAAWLRGVDLRCPGEPPLPVEVMVNRKTQPPRRTGVVSYQSTLPDADVERVGGHPVTSGLRTAVDLGRFRPRTEAVVALDALARTGLCRLDEVADRAQGLRGRRGVRRLLAVIPLADPRSESPMETRTRIVIIDGGLPPPEVQYEVLDRWGHVIARLDLAYPFHRLGIEFDGRVAHSSASSFARDRQRQNELLGAGWVLMRFVARDILRCPALVVRQIEHYLAAKPALRPA